MFALFCEAHFEGLLEKVWEYAELLFLKYPLQILEERGVILLSSYFVVLFLYISLPWTNFKTVFAATDFMNIQEIYLFIYF